MFSVMNPWHCPFPFQQKNSRQEVVIEVQLVCFLGPTAFCGCGGSDGVDELLEAAGPVNRVL